MGKSKRFPALLAFGIALALPPAANASGPIAVRGNAWHGQWDSQSQNSLKLNLPGGSHPGDVLVATLALTGGSSGPQPTVTAPSGWSLAERTNYGASSTLTVYTHVLASGESSFTFRTDVKVGGVAFTAAYVNVDPVNPVDVAVGQTATSTTQFSTPMASTAAAGEMLVTSYFGYRAGGPAAHWSPPAGLTEIGDAANGKGIASASIDDGLQAVAGSTGTKTAIASITQDFGIGALIALRPPAPPPPPPAISSVSAGGITPSGATISWTTDQASDSQVEYGQTSAYGTSTTLDPALVRAHSEIVGGLAPSTTYHYRVKSRNSSGQLSVSGDSTFTTPAASPAPTPLIVDTDIYSDADDVGALATAFGLQLQGEANVIAVGVNTRLSRPAVATNSWRCVAAIDQFYGFGSVPIGTDMPNNGTNANSPDFTAPCAALASATTPAPDTAVNVFRRALASQADGSVVIAEIGYHENLDALLHSPPDSISPLSGAQLIAQKVKELVVMAGGYPSRNGETNLIGNPGAAEDVAANWPTKIVWSGYEVGDAVHTGQSISAAHPANSPVRAAYEAFVGPNNWIYSYDLTAVYHAIRPGDSNLTEVGPGTNAIDSSGDNTFTLGAGDQYYLKLGSATGLDASIEQLLDVLPSSGSGGGTGGGGTGGGGGTTVTGPNDNFDTNTIDPTKWTESDTGSTVSATNQELEISHSGSSWTNGMLESAAYDQTGKSVQVHVVRPANGDQVQNGSEYGETSVMLRLDSSHLAEFFFAGGALTAWADNGSGAGEVNLTPDWPRYDPNAMQWVRFRESGGTLYFDYAATPGAWTTLASVPDPFSMTAVKLRLIAGSNVVATDVAKFDDVSTQ